MKYYFKTWIDQQQSQHYKLHTIYCLLAITVTCGDAVDGNFGISEWSNLQNKNTRFTELQTTLQI